ncbi:hypothetical protein OAR16_00505 [bacterium]|nr:hypothetical protein [bacterium]
MAALIVKVARLLHAARKASPAPPGDECKAALLMYLSPFLRQRGE